jgi:hypothetical protein
MSAAPKTIEGTWEEIQRHSKELAGHRLIVTVVDFPKSAQDTLSPEEWVARLREWTQSLPPVAHVVDDSRDTIYADRLDRQL